MVNVEIKEYPTLESAEVLVASRDEKTSTGAANVVDESETEDGASTEEDDAHSGGIEDTQSTETGTYSLGSAVSFINSGRAKKNSYGGNKTKLDVRDDTTDNQDGLPEPRQAATKQSDGELEDVCQYEMYGALLDSFSSSEISGGTKALYDDYADNFQRKVSSSSSEDNSTELAKDSSEDQDLGLFCFNLFLDDEDTTDEDRPKASQRRRSKRRSRRHEGRSRDAGTTSEKSVLKQKMKKLAKMTPSEAREYKKKMLRERLKNESKSRTPNVSKDLQRKQDEYLKQQEKKKREKQRRKREQQKSNTTKSTSAQRPKGKKKSSKYE